MFLTDSKQLNIAKTFECGQCFRWNADENGVYHTYNADVYEENSKVYIESDKDLEYWVSYFDLDEDYEQYNDIFDSIDYLKKCREYGQGIRILRQDPFEALISFIISQCNNIPRIKGIVETLCKGGPFPDACCLKDMDLTDLHAGYRTPYILNAAREVSDGTLKLDSLRTCSYEEAKNRLLQLNGVGEKVDNCAVLYGLHHMEAFPVDVWMKRALKENFPANFDPKSLGPFAGLAQQYIFYYARQTATDSR